MFNKPGFNNLLIDRCVGTNPVVMRTLLALEVLCIFATFTSARTGRVKDAYLADKAGAEATLPKVTAFEIIPGVIKALLGLSGIVFFVLMHAGFLTTAQGNRTAGYAKVRW